MNRGGLTRIGIARRSERDYAKTRLAVYLGLAFQAVSAIGIVGLGVAGYLYQRNLAEAELVRRDEARQLELAEKSEASAAATSIPLLEALFQARDLLQAVAKVCPTHGMVMGSSEELKMLAEALFEESQIVCSHPDAADLICELVPFEKSNLIGAVPSSSDRAPVPLGAAMIFLSNLLEVKAQGMKEGARTLPWGKVPPNLASPNSHDSANSLHRITLDASEPKLQWGNNSHPQWAHLDRRGLEAWSIWFKKDGLDANLMKSFPVGLAIDDVRTGVFQATMILLERHPSLGTRFRSPSTSCAAPDTSTGAAPQH